MQKQKLIPADFPCHEDYTKMKVCSEGLYCKSCTKHVIDLRQKPMDEIQHLLNEKDTACILIETRHTVNSSRYERLIQKVEQGLLFLKMKKISLAAATFLLFLGGCRGRTYCGGWSRQNTHAHEKINSPAESETERK